MPKIYVALAHYPVVNKNGDTIASALTNLDLHDISRAAKTYGVKSFYVVTPLADQKSLAEEIIAHWTNGAGADYNPSRQSALKLVRIKDSITAVRDQIHGATGEYPKTIVTCARKQPSSIGYEKIRSLLADGRPYLLIFGTAWGLSEQLITEADYVLAPIEGHAAYNHLSVRSAAAIILDRLLGEYI
jgi:hypothetical protein